MKEQVVTVSRKKPLKGQSRMTEKIDTIYRLKSYDISSEFNQKTYKQLQADRKEFLTPISIERT